MRSITNPYDIHLELHLSQHLSHEDQNLYPTLQNHCKDCPEQHWQHLGLNHHRYSHHHRDVVT